MIAFSAGNHLKVFVKRILVVATITCDCLITRPGSRMADHYSSLIVAPGLFHVIAKGWISVYRVA